MAHRVGGRHVDALESREGSEHLPAASGAMGGHGGGDLPHHLLAVSQHEEVHEVGQRLGVEGAVPTRADQQVVTRTVGGAHGHAGQIDEVQHVRVDQFRGEVEGQDVELAGAQVGVHREEREPLPAHQGLEVAPRGVGPLGNGVAALVEDLVEDLQPLVGQADLVTVGVAEQPGHLAGAVSRRACTLLAADVARRTLNLIQERL